MRIQHEILDPTCFKILSKKIDAITGENMNSFSMNYKMFATIYYEGHVSYEGTIQ